MSDRKRRNYTRSVCTWRVINCLPSKQQSVCDKSRIKIYNPGDTVTVTLPPPIITFIYLSLLE